MDPRPKQSVFGFDNQTKSYNLGKVIYGNKRIRQRFGSRRFNPKPEKSKIFGEYSEIGEQGQAKENRSFFSPYSPVTIGNWRGDSNPFTESFDPDPDRGSTSDKSRKLVKNIKILDREIEELRKSIESSGESSNDTLLDKAIKLINEK